MMNWQLILLLLSRLIRRYLKGISSRRYLSFTSATGHSGVTVSKNSAVALSSYVHGTRVPQFVNAISSHKCNIRQHLTSACCLSHIVDSTNECNCLCNTCSPVPIYSGSYAQTVLKPVNDKHAQFDLPTSGRAKLNLTGICWKPTQNLLHLIQPTSDEHSELWMPHDLNTACS